MKAYLRLAVLISASLAVFLTSCINRTDPVIDESSNRVVVRVISVNPRQVLSSSSYVGSVEPSKSTTLLSQFPGTVDNVCAVRGRKVSKGTVLATVASEAVQSAYDIAKATLDQAQDGYERACKVYQSGTLTEVKMVEIRTQLEQAVSAEKSARKALEECKVTAPFNGVVGEVYVHSGERVTAAQPVMQIVDVESVEIHFNVPESEYSRIDIGTKAQVEIPALDRTVTGEVAVKGVSASILSHAYDFTLKNISDPNRMMPGMTCKIRLESASEEGLFVIPASSVRTDSNGRYVWTVESDNRVSKRYVSVSGFSGTGVTVSEGLSAGDLVIVEGSRKVSTGMIVKTAI